jgi:Restriction endonuclease fold toxin 7
VRIAGTGRGEYRVPDFDPELTINARNAVVEVKDVARLTLSSQLRDMVAYAQSRGVPLEIFTNGRLRRRGQLADWIGEGVVVILPL